MTLKTSLFLMLICFACALYFITPAKSMAPRDSGCDFPPPGFTLIAKGSADGKPVCAYHKSRGYGQAK